MELFQRGDFSGWVGRWVFSCCMEGKRDAEGGRWACGVGRGGEGRFFTISAVWISLESGRFGGFWWGRFASEVEMIEVGGGRRDGMWDVGGWWRSG